MERRRGNRERTEDERNPLWPVEGDTQTHEAGGRMKRNTGENKYCKGSESEM